MKSIVAGFCLAASTVHAGAVEYLGFELGEMSQTQVLTMLQSKKAEYDDTHGYKGYKELPTIKVLRYDRFDEIGPVSESWLEFTPKGILYNVTIQFRDSGKTYKSLREALETKYGRPHERSKGSESAADFRSSKMNIHLIRSNFGVGDDQITTLMYERPDLLPEVRQMRARIEAHIKSKNAKRPGADL